MLRLEVEVFYLKSEEDVLTQDAGIELSFEDCVLKKYKLYSIDFITSYDKNKCVISSGGLDMIVNESYESVNSRIEAQITCLLN